MLKLITATAALALVVACDPKETIPPGSTLYEGRVIEKRGPCHWIAGRDGKTYSVRFGVLGEIPASAAVRIIGKPAALQDCPGSVVIEPTLPIKRI